MLVPAADFPNDGACLLTLQGFEAELRAAMAAGCPTAAAVARQRRDRGATDREHWGAPVPSGGPVKALGTGQQAAPVPVAQGKPAARSNGLESAKERFTKRSRQGRGKPNAAAAT